MSAGLLPTTRDRVLDAAAHLVETQGWSAVSMSGIARAVGVSRQTVHNELGTKHALAQALAMRELQRFLDVVRDRIAEQSELVAAVRAGCEGALEMGESSLLVRSIVTSVPAEQDVDLIAILTTESGQIVELASMVVKDEVTARFAPLPFDDAELDIALDMVVRLVLSHITRPSKPPRQAAAEIAWVLELAVRARRDAAGEGGPGQDATG